MTVQAPGAEPEVIEQTFHEYGMVVLGQKTPEEFLTDPQQVLELKANMNLWQTTVENMKLVLGVKDATIGELRGIISEMIANKPEPVQAPAVYQTFQMLASSNATAEANATFNFRAEVSTLQGALAELAEQLPADSPGRQALEQASAGLDGLPAEPGGAAKSAPMSRARRVLADLGDEKSPLSKVLKGAKEAGKIAQAAGKAYKSIAEWCGLPVVPRVLLGRGGD